MGKMLDQLARNARVLGETKSASMSEIFSPEFVSTHTRFSNVDEFFKASGFDVFTQADFEAIPEQLLDSFVRTESSYESWREMVKAAGTEWARRKLGL
jgi:hypothetical protein